MAAKYAIYDSEMLGREYPIVFPEFINHNEVCSVGRRISAGRLEFDSNGEPYAYGESYTASLHSHPEANTTLLKLLFKN